MRQAHRELTERAARQDEENEQEADEGGCAFGLTGKREAFTDSAEGQIRPARKLAAPAIATAELRWCNDPSSHA